MSDLNFNVENKTNLEGIMHDMYKGMIISDDTDKELRNLLNREFALWCGRNNITEFEDYPTYEVTLSI